MKRGFDSMDELITSKRHWSEYQLNGKSAQENYAAQKEEFLKLHLARQLSEEYSSAEESTNVQFTIKSEVK